MHNYSIVRRQNYVDSEEDPQQDDQQRTLRLT
jgi:hypothetical protein